jgi:uncharacterized membrane protein
MEQQQGGNTAVFRGVSYRGPIPTPQDLEYYERVHPGLANRIMTMAENQSEHRQTLEKSVVKTNNFSQILGQIFGFIICTGAITGGIYLALKDKKFEGLGTIITTILSFGGIYIYGKRTQSKELESKKN